MRRLLLPIFLATMPLPGNGMELHCLGRDPGFMLVITDATARLDYLGDGVFEVTPPLPDPLPDFSSHALTTAGGDLPVFIERRACETFGITLPFAVELGIPAFAGRRPAMGCCRESSTE